MTPFPRLAIFSQLIQSPRQLFVRQFAALRPRHKLLRLGYGGVPLVCADFAPLLSDLQAVVGPVVFLPGRGAVGPTLGFLAVGPYLAAGALSFAGGDVVAVAGVVPGGQEEVASAVVAPPRRVARGQPPVKLRPQKVRQTAESGLLRDEDLACLSGVHHGHKAHLQGEALPEVLVKQMGADREHMGVEEGVGAGIGVGVPPLQRLKVVLRHEGDLLAKGAKAIGKANRAASIP